MNEMRLSKAALHAATYEAGRALVLALHGVEITRIVAPDAGARGKVEFPSEIVGGISDEMEATEAIAGLAAQRLLDRRSMKLEKLARACFRPRSETRLAYPGDLEMLETFVGLRELEGKAATEFRDQAWRDALMTLAARWPAVEQLAFALVEKQILEGDCLETLLSGVYGRGTFASWRCTAWVRTHRAMGTRVKKQIETGFEDGIAERLHALAGNYGSVSQVVRAAVAIGLPELEQRNAPKPPTTKLEEIEAKPQPSTGEEWRARLEELRAVDRGSLSSSNRERLESAVRIAGMMVAAKCKPVRTFASAAK